MQKLILVIGGISLDTNVKVYGLPVGSDGIDVSYVTNRVLDHIGGSAMNVAFSLQKLGSEIQLVSVLGRDFMGRFIKERLEELAFDTGRLILEWEKNSRSVNLVEPGGKRYILHDSRDAMTYTMPPKNYRDLLQ